MELYSERISCENFKIYPPIGVDKTIKELNDAIKSGAKRLLLIGGVGTGKSLIGYHVLSECGFDIKYLNCGMEMRNQKNIVEYLKKMRCGYSVIDSIKGNKKRFALLIDDIHFYEVYGRNTILEAIPKNIVAICTMCPPVETKFSTNFQQNGIITIQELPKTIKSRIIDQVLGNEYNKLLSKKKREDLLENKDISEIIKFCIMIIDTFNLHGEGSTKELNETKKLINVFDIDKDDECIDYDMKSKIRKLLKDKMSLESFCSIFEVDSFVFQNLFIQNLCNILRNNRNEKVYHDLYMNIITSNKFNTVIHDVNYTAIISYYGLNGKYQTDDIENNNKINNILAAKSNFKNITENINKQYPILPDNYLKLNSQLVLYYIYFKMKELSTDEEWKDLLKELKTEGKLQELYEVIYFDTQINTKFKTMLKTYT